MVQFYLLPPLWTHPQDSAAFPLHGGLLFTGRIEPYITVFFLTSEGKDEVTSSSSCVEKLGEQSPKKVRIRHSCIFYAFESYSVTLELHVLLFSRLSRHCISVVSHVWPKKYCMFVYPPHIIPEREIEIASHMNKVLDDRKNHQFSFSQNPGSVIWP